MLSSHAPPPAGNRLSARGGLLFSYLYTMGTQSQVFFAEQPDEVAEDNVGDDDRDDCSDPLIPLLHGLDVLPGLSQPHLDWRRPTRTRGLDQGHLRSRVGRFPWPPHIAV